MKRNDYQRKPYKLKCEFIITAEGEIKQLFVCDKTKCPKSYCENNKCYQTSDIKYAQRFDLNE